MLNAKFQNLKLISLDYISDYHSTLITSYNILASVRVRNCTIDWDDLSYLGTKIQLCLSESVIDDHSPVIRPLTEDWKLEGLKDLVEMQFTFYQMTKSLFVHDLFPTQESMPSMSVLTLHCYLPGARLSLNDTLCRPNQIAFDPLRLNASFPKLQSFAFKRVYPVKDKTINFPWFPNKLPISNGLYRSYYYRHLSYYSTTDLNHTRRIYSLQSTDLKPATIFPLKNEVNEVVLRQCNLRSIPWDAFLNVTNLRYLDISSNPLTYLSSRLLKNKVCLVKLYISHTNLTAFEDGTFRDLQTLNLLDISNNKLKFLQQGLFRNLKNLEILSAHDNAITTID